MITYIHTAQLTKKFIIMKGMACLNPKNYKFIIVKGMACLNPKNYLICQVNYVIPFTILLIKCPLS